MCLMMSSVTVVFEMLHGNTHFDVESNLLTQEQLCHYLS